MGVVNDEGTKQRDRLGVPEDRENRERAKQVILQILRQADNGSLGKSRLFKAFWLAHLLYAKENTGYLSAWKIVRLPHGPGIDRGDQIILELRTSGAIRLTHEPRGPYTETVCVLAREPAADLLGVGAIAAIQSAFQIVNTETVAQIAEWSHEFSRSWNLTPNGKELDIYTDLIPDDVYEERRQALQKMNDAYDDLFR
jgi:hypothetical protein